MIKLYAVEALVIRGRDFGEADKILTLYTKEQGKVQAIAKGVRKPTSRLRGGVQVFSYSNLLLHRGRTLDTVSQAETINAFGGIRDDLLRFIYASYLVELLEAAVPDREPNSKLFVLTLLCLGMLLGEDPELICRLFEIRLLYLLGYQPYLSECMVCHRPLGNGSLFLDPAAGGIVCGNCTDHGRIKSRISPGIVLIMKKLLTMDPRQIFRLKISASMRTELETALENYIGYYLDKTIKAKQVLRSMLKDL